MNPLRRFLRPALTIAATLLATISLSAQRERLLMDFGWRFHLGNEWGIGINLAKSGTGYGPASAAFSDAGWRQLDLPHDWAIELPFDPKADCGHGFKPLGVDFPDNSIAWYRRSFDLPATDAGKRLWLEFDGAFRDCLVYVNGWFVGHHESGYSSFRYDITDVAECGARNVVTVRVDASEPEGWFYEGAGIYRHVWLVKTAPLALAPDGVFVRSSFPHNVPAGPATIHLEARLTNAGSTVGAATVSWEILDPAGRSVAKASASGSVAAGGTTDLGQTTIVAAPELWSPETPRLYKLVTSVTGPDGELDRSETEFGIRTFAFDTEKGFLLNGQPYVIKGTCNHQDHAGVGVALGDRLQWFRLQRLKEMGGNAYRTAHNPPTPELLDACDRLGLLVMDESRVFGSDGANLDRLERLIRRDRNHASVAIWSLANEEFTTQGTPSGKRVAATMQALIKRLDPSRPVTYNSTAGNAIEGINEVVEVRGWSYRIGVDRMDAYHAAHPEQPNVGSEQGSTITTRGIYTTDPERGYMSAYDDNQTDWSNTAKQWAGFFHTRPWLSGGFVWTGFDYRGEPTPYEWPCISSHFGIMDTCGFPKDNFYLYQSWWTEKPMVHLLPHWNWAGREGEEIDVRAYSNCDEVELFLNGTPLGRRKMEPVSELKWTVPYAPGILSAKAYRAGRIVAQSTVETTGAPAAVRLFAERPAIAADGEDLAIVTVSVVDAQGRTVPSASNAIDFALTGPGRIIGVGNGDPSCHEPDTFLATPVTARREIGGWRWMKIADAYAKALPEAAGSIVTTDWAPADPFAEHGPLEVAEHGVLRATFTVSEAELASSAIELRFGKIRGTGHIHLNGEHLAPTGDSRAANLFDAKAKLRVGENTIAIALANYGANGGLSGGVQLVFHGTPVAPRWSRSVFNGLAQVIVRAGKTTGPIKLTATADGLAPTTLTIETEPAVLRPAVD